MNGDDGEGRPPHAQNSSFSATAEPICICRGANWSPSMPADCIRAWASSDQFWFGPLGGSPMGRHGEGRPPHAQNSSFSITTGRIGPKLQIWAAGTCPQFVFTLCRVCISFAEVDLGLCMGRPPMGKGMGRGWGGEASPCAEQIDLSNCRADRAHTSGLHSPNMPADCILVSAWSECFYFFDSLAAPHGEGDGEASPCAKQFVLNNHCADRPQTSDLDSLYMPAVCISFVACLLLNCRSSLLADGGRVGGDSA